MKVLKAGTCSYARFSLSRALPQQSLRQQPLRLLHRLRHLKQEKIRQK
jgi:hypothetical protein